MERLDPIDVGDRVVATSFDNAELVASAVFELRNAMAVLNNNLAEAFELLRPALEAIAYPDRLIINNSPPHPSTEF